MNPRNILNRIEEAQALLLKRNPIKGGGSYSMPDVIRAANVLGRLQALPGAELKREEEARAAAGESPSFDETSFGPAEPVETAAEKPA